MPKPQKSRKWPRSRIIDQGRVLLQQEIITEDDQLPSFIIKEVSRTSDSSDQGEDSSSEEYIPDDEASDNDPEKDDFPDRDVEHDLHNNDSFEENPPEQYPDAGSNNDVIEKNLAEADLQDAETSEEDNYDIFDAAWLTQDRPKPATEERQDSSVKRKPKPRFKNTKEKLEKSDPEPVKDLNSPKVIKKEPLTAQQLVPEAKTSETRAAPAAKGSKDKVKKDANDIKDRPKPARYKLGKEKQSKDSHITIKKTSPVKPLSKTLMMKKEQSDPNPSKRIRQDTETTQQKATNNPSSNKQMKQTRRDAAHPGAIHKQKSVKSKEASLTATHKPFRTTTYTIVNGPDQRLKTAAAPNKSLTLKDRPSHQHEQPPAQRKSPRLARPKIETNPESQFKCRLCKAALASRDMIGPHFQQFHAQYKPFRCQECPFLGVSVLEVQNHMKRGHVKNKYKVFRCEPCNRSFREMSHLQSHLQQSKVHRK